MRVPQHAEASAIAFSDRRIGRNVLLVEDNLLDSKLMLHRLSQVEQRLQVTVAVDIAQARHELTSGKHWDLVLTDLELPDSGGMDTVAQLLEHCGDIPMVVLTGLEDPAESGLQAVRAGAQDFVPKSHATSELLSRVITYAIERARLITGLRDQAFVDNVTKLPNRWLTTDRLDGLLALARREARSVAALIIHIADLEAATAQFGQPAVDEVLRQIGWALRLLTRETDVVGRWSPDEFVVAGYVDGSIGTEVLAQRIVHRIADAFEVDEDLISVSARVGAAICVNEPTDAPSLLRLAQVAGHEAAQAGVDLRIKVHDSEGSHTALGADAIDGSFAAPLVAFPGTGVTPL